MESDLQDRETTWESIIENKKMLAGSTTKYYIKKVMKFIPDMYSTIRHTNHMRPMLRYCIKKFGDKPIVGCEVGVGDGKHAFNMLYHLNTTRVYMVDSWVEYDGYSSPNAELIFNECKYRVKRFKERAVFIRKMSHEAVDDIYDKLDFVYIDGNHNYSFVKRDIELYYSLLKTGGVLGGHDFSSCTPNVARAVIEFADKEGLRINGIGHSDWWVIKKDNGGKENE